MEESCAIIAKVSYLRGMSDDLQIEFQKWEGTGNTFVIVNGFKYEEKFDFTTLEDKVVEKICTDQNCDGLIILCKSQMHEADLRCDYRNSDGSRSFCGNGTRASFAYARREGLVGDSAVFEACDGLHRVRHNDTHKAPSVEFMPVGSPESLKSGDYFIDTGSPHHIHLVQNFDELSEVDILDFGSKIRYSDRYSSMGGTNVSVLCPVEDGLALRTYERGVEGETKACGTGAVAASIIHHTINGGDNNRTVHMPGGKLFVDFAEDGRGGYEKVWLSGVANEISRGITSLLTMLLLWFCIPSIVQASWHDTLSDETEISVLTASPGDDLYSVFGHTAVRIYDPTQVPIVDWVFNYGTFSFSDDFYYNFLKGRLDYKLSASPFYLFKQEYMDQGRGVEEQKLNLSPSQIRQVAQYLSFNLKEENSVYRYDFFRDNCATRVILLFQESLVGEFKSNCEQSGRTFRDGLQPYLAGSPWTSLGINFLLGPKSDMLMPPCGDSFIPDDLSKSLTKMTIGGASLIKLGNEETVVFDEGNWLPPHALDYPTILLVLWTLSLTIVTIRNNQRCVVANTLRFSVAVFSSILGGLLLLIWGFTSHTDIWGNINLLFTLPAFVYFIPNKSKLKTQAGTIASVMCVSYLLVSFIDFQLSSLALRCAAVSVFLTVLPFRKDLNSKLR